MLVLVLPCGQNLSSPTDTGLKIEAEALALGRSIVQVGASEDQTHQDRASSCSRPRVLL